MPLVINTNVAALNAQRQLVSSGSDMAMAMERLSSGKRINSAADDAAGLAISNRQTSQIRGLTQAIRNANDGISLIQTAEGALDESTNVLQRMRELSVQAANGIYSDNDRATLDAEFQQLIQELDRIAATTSFNGQLLLDGSLSDVKLQVGAEANQTISFSIGAMSSSKLGLGATTADLNGGRITVGSDIGEGDVQINQQALAAISNLGSGGATDTTIQDVIDDINDNIEGVSASGYNVIQAEATGTGVVSSTQTLRITLAAADDQADVNFDISNTESMDDLVATINQVTGGNVHAGLDENGRLALTNATGGTITISIDLDNTDNLGVYDTTASAPADTAIETITGISVSGDNGTESFTGSIALTSDDGSTITITKGANGTDASLAALGFPAVIGAGEVLGAALDSTSQDDDILSGDVIINGVNIGAVEQGDGLQAKVDAINAVSDETGVTANIVAQDATTPRITDDFTELTSSALTFANNDTILINGVTVTLTGSATITADEAAVDINLATTNTGVTAFVDSAGDLHLFSEGQITLGDGTGAVTDFGNITDQDGATAVAAAGTYAPTAPTDGSITINGTPITLSDLASLDTIVSDINSVSGSTGVRVAVDDNGELQFSSASRINIQLGQTGNALEALAVLGIDLQTWSTVRAATTVNGALATVFENGDTIDGVALATGDRILLKNQTTTTENGVYIVQASGAPVRAADYDTAGEVNSTSIFVTLGTANANLAFEQTATIVTVGTTPMVFAAADGDLSDDVFIINPALRLTSADDRPISIEVTANGSAATGLQSLNTDLSATVVGASIASLSIATYTGAQGAIKPIDNALETINSIRSDMGAINNRLEFTISNLANISENTAAARSRIVDADFAAETANLSRSQVLQQASQAMLAQANAQPKQVLQLLQG